MVFLLAWSSSSELIGRDRVVAGFIFSFARLVIGRNAEVANHCLGLGVEAVHPRSAAPKLRKHLIPFVLSPIAAYFRPRCNLGSPPQSPSVQQRTPIDERETWRVGPRSVRVNVGFRNVGERTGRTPSALKCETRSTSLSSER
jgi:hypothetical protein